MGPGELIFLALALGGLWFMTDRSKKQQRSALGFRDSLAPGQQVMTGSGLFGTVVEVDGDAITLESAGSRSVWLRAAISKLAEPPVAVLDEDDEVDELEVPDDLSSLDEDGNGEPPSK